MWQTYLSTWRRFISCKGRSNRREYWIWVLFNFIIFVSGAFVLAIAGVSEGVFKLINAVVSLAAGLTSLGLSARRLQDTNASGWWLLLCLVPIVNLLLSLYIAFWPGTEGENRFGPEPF